MAMRAMATMVTVAAVLAGVGMTDTVVEKNRVGTMDIAMDNVRMRRSSRGGGGSLTDERVKVNLDSELVRLQQAIGQCHKMRNAMMAMDNVQFMNRLIAKRKVLVVF